MQKTLKTKSVREHKLLSIDHVYDPMYQRGLGHVFDVLTPLALVHYRQLEATRCSVVSIHEARWMHDLGRHCVVLDVSTSLTTHSFSLLIRERRGSKKKERYYARKLEQRRMKSACVGIGSFDEQSASTRIREQAPTTAAPIFSPNMGLLSPPQCTRTPLGTARTLLGLPVRGLSGAPADIIT